MQKARESVLKQEAERLHSLTWQNEMLLKAQEGMVRELTKLREANKQLTASNQELQNQLEGDSVTKLRESNRQLRKELMEKEADYLRVQDQNATYYKEVLRLQEITDDIEIQRHFKEAAEKLHNMKFGSVRSYRLIKWEIAKKNEAIELLEGKKMELEEELRRLLEVEKDPLSGYSCF